MKHIFNVKGEVLIQKEVNALSQVKVPISRLTNGIYLIQLLSSDKMVVRKKAVNSLISDELVTLLTKNMKEMNELNAITVDCLYQLIRLEWVT